MTASTQSTGPVVVIGAGAAGLMAAIFASASGRRVLLLERTTDGGRKILISGGGRCNILPSQLDPACFVTDSSPHTLRNILRSWPLAEQQRFLEELLGQPLVLEPETGKLFPASNRARDVRDGLVASARTRGVVVRFGARVTAVESVARAAGWQVRIADSEAVAATAVIIATGGLSVPSTGSDGFGLTLASSLGHTLHSTYAALTPLTAHPPIHGDLTGVSLPVVIEATVSGAPRRFRAQGGFLFTHHGYSGPAVLDASHLAVRSRQAGEHQVLQVRWGGVEPGVWRAELRASSAQRVATVLRQRLPERLADRLLAESSIASDRTLAQLRRPEREALLERLLRYELPWTGDEGYRKAEVTGGGVALSEVDPRTLESRRHPGLFFCGEVLDAFGPIGGYNFAWAWATGRLAGLAQG